MTQLIETFGTFSIFNNSEEYALYPNDVDILDKLMNGQQVNLISLKIYLLKNSATINNQLLELFQKYTNNLNQQIQNLLDNNEFTLERFFEQYHNYINNVKQFKKVVEQITPNLFVNDKQINFIHVYSYYLLFQNVIYKYYTCSEVLIAFNDLLYNYINNDILNSFSLYKLYNLYHGFFCVYKINQQYLDYVKQTLNINDTVNKLDTNNLLKLTELINVSILELTKNYDQITKVVDYIKFGLTSNNRIFFISTYYQNLLTRLNNTNSNPEVELKLLEVFPIKYEPELYSKMLFCIKDTIGKKTIDKYAYSFYNSYSWNLNNTSSALLLPSELNTTTELLNTLKSKNPNKNFIVDYNNSVINFKLTFSNEIYTFKSTLLQYALLSIILKNNNIIVSDILSQLQITNLSHFSIALNSLISCKLIKRDLKFVPGDKNMPLYFTSDWKNDSDFIDLIEYKTKIEQLANKITNQQNIIEQYKLEQLLITFIQQNPSITKKKYYLRNKTHLTHTIQMLLPMQLIN